MFKPLAAENIPIVAAIESVSYPDPWSESLFYNELTNPASHFYVEFVSEELVGYGGFWLAADEADILTVTVSPMFRGKGLGRALLEFLLEEARRRGASFAMLEVRVSNTVARTLYQSAGFYEVGLRKGYYDHGGEDAILMRRNLIVDDPDLSSPSKT